VLDSTILRRFEHEARGMLEPSLYNALLGHLLAELRAGDQRERRALLLREAGAFLPDSLQPWPRACALRSEIEALLRRRPLPQPDLGTLQGVLTEYLLSLPAPRLPSTRTVYRALSGQR
jgi:hypothetical protein